ncbi:MAG: histidine phosphatase family protein [Spirochaetaceae bacterium]|nr:histidine phosphatase family protein [Spirochaetaceae bacterium]
MESVTGYGIDRLFCSAMHRSLLTARPVGKALGLQPEIWVDIHECGGIFLNHPDGRGTVGYPGMTRETIARGFSNVIIPPEVSSDGWWDPRRGEEDWPACQGRAVKVADRRRACAEDEPDATVAMISHAGFIEALIKALTSQLPGQGIVYHHFNTALTRMDFTGDSRLDIRYINRVPHLRNELVS